MSARTILVIRATGSQGIAACRHLREKGFNVHGLAHDISDKRVAPLKDLDIKFFQGKGHDRAAVDRAIAGCAGVFIGTWPNWSETDSELHQAETVLEAARAAGVTQIVSSTSMGVGRMDTLRRDLKNDMPAQLTEGKEKVEVAVRNASFKTFTILRPGYFMNNFLWPLGNAMFPELAPERKFISSYTPDAPLALIDPDDIGAFAASAFEDPGKFAGVTVELVGEKLPTQVVIEKLSAAADIPIEGVYRTKEESEALAETNAIVASQLMTMTNHALADAEYCRSFGVKMGTFENFLAREKESVQSTFSLEHKSLKML